MDGGDDVVDDVDHEDHDHVHEDVDDDDVDVDDVDDHDDGVHLSVSACIIAGRWPRGRSALGANCEGREPNVKLNGEPHHDHRPSLRRDELEAMLIYSMSVSADGFIADREGGFEWTAPSEEQFRFHVAQVRELGGYLLGRRLYETMLPWETDPSMRDNEIRAAFADIWCAIPKVVFSRTLDSVQANARLAEASVAEEVAAALDKTDKDVSIGGAGLAAAAIEDGLVEELRMFRYPVVIGGGTPFLPPVTERVPLDLIESRTVGSRVIYERYRRALDESD